MLLVSKWMSNHTKLQPSQIITKIVLSVVRFLYTIKKIISLSDGTAPKLILIIIMYTFYLLGSPEFWVL